MVSKKSREINEKFKNKYQKISVRVKKVVNIDRYKRWIQTLGDEEFKKELQKEEKREKWFNSLFDKKWILAIPLAILGFWPYFVTKISNDGIDENKSVILIFGSLILFLTIIFVITTILLIYRKVNSSKLNYLNSYKESSNGSN